MVVSILAYSWQCVIDNIVERPRPKSKRAHKSIPPHCLPSSFVVECTHAELLLAEWGVTFVFLQFCFSFNIGTVMYTHISHQLRLTPAALCIKSPFVANVDSLFVGKSVVRFVDPPEA